jgi:hypothetical protein
MKDMPDSSLNSVIRRVTTFSPGNRHLNSLDLFLFTLSIQGICVFVTTVAVESEYDLPSPGDC